MEDWDYSDSDVKRSFAEQVFDPVQQALDILNDVLPDLDRASDLLNGAYQAMKFLRKKATILDPLLLDDDRDVVHWPTTSSVSGTDALDAVLQLRKIVVRFPESDVIYASSRDFDAAEHYIGVVAATVSQEALRLRIESVLRSEAIKNAQDRARRELIKAANGLIAVVDLHKTKGQVNASAIKSATGKALVAVSLARSVFEVTASHVIFTGEVVRLGPSAIGIMSSVASDMLQVAQRATEELTSEVFDRLSERLTFIASNMETLARPAPSSSKPKASPAPRSKTPPKQQARKRTTPAFDALVEVTSLYMY